MARLSFDVIFKKNPDGTIEPRQAVRIGGVTLAPGLKISLGAIYGGVELARYVDHELEITYDDGTAVITGIY